VLDKQGKGKMLLSSSSRTRLPNLFLQVRHFTARRPKYEQAELREEKHNLRAWALGKRTWPAITASQDDVIFSIQQKVFGYDRGGEGIVPEGMVLRPGKKPVPVKTGRKLARKLEVTPSFSSWYPIDSLGKLRYQEIRAMKSNPKQQIEGYLGIHKVKGLGEEEFGPFPELTPEWERARMRSRAYRVLQSVQINASVTALEKLDSERRREQRIMALRKRGKAAPKKGQGKRATGGKPGKK
jgi:hypothetical protein